MDAKRWNVANSLVGVPEMCGHLLGFSVLYYDFASNTEISVKPCPPKSATIHLDVELLRA